MPDSDSGMFQQFPAVPGGVWKLDAHIMTTCVESPIKPGNENFVLARLLFKDSGGGEVGSADSIILDGNVSLGTWAQHTLMAEAPAGTDSDFYLIENALIKSGFVRQPAESLRDWIEKLPPDRSFPHLI